jgi:hypothetical protein
MRKVLIIVIAACVIIAVALGLYFLPIPHHVKIAMDGYIIYQNGSEMKCSVTLEGKYQDRLFENAVYWDLFDGTVAVNGAVIGVENCRVSFHGEAGHTSYTSTSTDANGITTVLRRGDLLLGKACDTLVVSCCYDGKNNTDTADEAYRCLVVAPAKNRADAENIIALYDTPELLQKFDTWTWQGAAPAGDAEPTGDAEPAGAQAAAGSNEAHDIEKAVANAILDRAGPHRDGECRGEGHCILDTKTDGTSVTAYVLVMEGDYGFEDGNFVKVTGSGVIPTVMTFSLDAGGIYSLTNYQIPEDGSSYAPSIRRLFPEALQDECLNVSADRAKDLKKQEREYASAYLKAIGRDAVIGDFGDFAHPLLTDLGVSIEISNLMIDNFKTYNYPFWVGNRERIEDGIRYTYQVEYDKGAHTITYTKLEYDTKTVVQKTVFDAASGKELPQP